MLGRWTQIARTLMQVVLAFTVICASLYLLALDTLDRIKAAPPSSETRAMPVSELQLWALWPVIQVLPMHQPHAEARPGRTFQDCDTCPEMVELPPAHVLIGSPMIETERFTHLRFPRSLRQKLRHSNREGARRVVTLPRAFAISRFELTRGEWLTAQSDPDWEAITGLPARPASAHAFDGMNEGERSPQLNLDWDDGAAYARWLSATTGQTYRMPTEVEWEYAARAGSTSAFSWGDQVGSDLAACSGCGGAHDSTAPPEVGTYDPNAFGLYDMHGSAWEWTLDCFRPFYSSQNNSGGFHDKPDCQYRTVRGGSWQESPWQMRSAMRVGPHYYNRNEGTSLRLVREFP
nr:SUMF1/EgtB/PvdO family nonheme iron enzyme [Hyphomonas sp. Mor2]